MSRISAAQRPRLVALLLAAAAVIAAAVLLVVTRDGGEPDEPAGRSAVASPLVTPSPPPPSRPPSPAAARVVSALEYGATPDDDGDDTAAILAALRDVAGTGVGVHLPAGLYRVTTLRVPDGSRLVGDGARSRLLGGVELGARCRVSDLTVGADGRAFRFADGATRCLLTRVTFVGGGSTGSGDDHGVIRFTDDRTASHIAFTDCVIGANSADGNGVSIVDQGWEGATYHDLTWRRCVFKGSPRMSFECIQRPDGVHPMTTGYHSIDLIDCVFEPSGSETVSFDAVHEGGSSRITGCTFLGAGWNDAYPWKQTVEFNRATDMVFSGNTVYRGLGAMINHNGVPGEPDGTVISDNVFDATVAYIPKAPSREIQLIYFNNVNGARFTRNTVRSDAGGELAYLSGSSDNVFAGNRFIDTRPADEALACIKFSSSSHDNRFSGELFRTAAAVGALVAVAGSTGNLVERSTFVTGEGRPVTVEAGSSILLMDNTYR
ncbi:MAG: hypothetical protein GX624_10220 [Actinobacteria bacterium]|nr:hypothetical protein [Actinomycetota bacterium]